MGKRVLMSELTQYVTVLALVLKTLFLELNKIQSSMFPVKCVGVKLVKQDKVSAKDREFKKSSIEMLKKYAILGGGLQCDPGQ